LTLDQFGITELYPTTGGGLEWFSNWQSGVGGPRYITNQTYDSTDADFGALVGQTNTGKLLVRCGECRIKELGEYRLFVDGPWTNTEMTIYAKIKDSTTSSIQLRSRSNHFAVGYEPYSSTVVFVSPNPQGVADYMSCGFGNYFVRWGQSTNPLSFVDVDIEIIHELYGLGHAKVDPYNIPNDEWIGYKQVTRTLANGHVKVEGYNNMNADKTTWTLATEFEFDGSNAALDAGTLSFWNSFTSYCTGKGDNLCPDVNSHQLFEGPGKWCWVRINGASKVDLKYFSVREIVPY
jgi:hypothetical protein